MVAPPARKSASAFSYLLVVAVLVEGEVEVEDGFFEEFGEIDLLPLFGGGYLYSLTITVSAFFTEIMSLSPRVLYFLESGRLRMATRILGCYIFKILIISDKSIYFAREMLGSLTSSLVKVFRIQLKLN